MTTCGPFWTIRRPSCRSAPVRLMPTMAASRRGPAWFRPTSPGCRTTIDWPGLAAIGKVVRVRETPGRTTTETAYYLLSAAMSAERFGEVVRSHWGDRECAAEAHGKEFTMN